ncbi:DUF4405 domain-containing protein [Clostridium nigeriense]|uniref:DUF4405 domain-containing protein n=1 Tax=Clostridium nigeriense TaxID=1805470 RepID=UPI003D32E485
MKAKLRFKMIIDVLLTISLLLQMAYILIGEALHEWLGTIMFILFIFHLILNRNWIKAIYKGKYSLLRIFQTVINILIFICMLSLMISGIMMSRYVFSFLPIHGGMSFARSLHMLSSYWGFLLMSIHVGLHWNMIISMFRKKKVQLSEVYNYFLQGIAIIIFIYGIYCFAENEIISYLLANKQFAFFDVSKPFFFFIIEYIAMMGSIIFLTVHVRGLLLKIRNK